ncbi:MAG: hypothetical protein WD557_18315 [Dehalococcoidia bacterium]
MTGLETFLLITLGVLYIGLIMTVCMVTFQKGHWLLGILGFFLPLLWLVGAILPAKRGSSYEVREARRWEMQVNQMTR